MVAFQGSDPIAVMIGAKRPSGTLIHKIAVHPDHCRQGHGRHLLTSLSSKLAILGPPRMVAEVPETFAASVALFDACDYVQESILTDYVLDQRALTVRQDRVEGFVIPITVDDLAANGLLAEADAEAGKDCCWERSVETLTARKDDIAGLAIASDERIEAYLLYVPGEIVALRSFSEDGEARLQQLLSRLPAQGSESFRFPKVHPAEISKELLETLGFRPARLRQGSGEAAGGHRLYAARARSE